MKKLLFCSFLFLSSNVLGQDNKILIGASFSPEYSYRTLKSTGKVNSFGMTDDDFVDLLNDREIGKFGFTTGISAIYNFSELFGIETGVQYSVKGYQTKWIEPNLLVEPNDPTVPDKWNFIYRYEYIDIPLKANFTFGKNRLRYIATAGITANFLIDAKEIFVGEYGDKTKKQKNFGTSYCNNFNISPIIGAGIEYKITDKINIRAIPNFKYGLIKIYDDPYKSEHLWSAGIDIGIFYGIK